MKPSVLLACCASARRGRRTAADTPPAADRTPLQSGIETQYFDAAVKPADDFYQHVNGKWLATTAIPPDKPSWSPAYVLHEEAQERLRKIIDEAAAAAPRRRAPKRARSAISTRASWTRRGSRRSG